MSISTKTRKMLWGNSASICNFPDCKRVLTIESMENKSIIGEECHIVAKEIGGPRGGYNLTKEERDDYNNLILLCSIHHKLVDDQSAYYTVEKLKEIKEKHETWVKEKLSDESKESRYNEIYLSYINKWCELCDIDNWNSWISDIAGYDAASISERMNNKLYELRKFLLRMILPEKYPELNIAFENFRLILDDLYNQFHKHSIRWDQGFKTNKFYQIDEWDEQRYHKLLNEYKSYMKILEKLSIELTKAGNYLCQKIREYILPSFQLHTGALSITFYNCFDSKSCDLMDKEYCVTYTKDSISTLPYKGLNYL